MISSRSWAVPAVVSTAAVQPVQPAEVRNFVDLRALRAAGLYADDASKAMRKSHENPGIQQLYKEFFGEPGSPSGTRSIAYPLQRAQPVLSSGVPHRKGAFMFEIEKVDMEHHRPDQTPLGASDPRPNAANSPYFADYYGTFEFSVRKSFLQEKLDSGAASIPPCWWTGTKKQDCPGSSL